MKKLVFLTIIVMIGVYTASGKADLSEYQWKNRLIVILTDDAENPILEKQQTAFEKEKAGMAERKLLVFLIFPEKDKEFVKKTSGMIFSDELYSKYKKHDKPYQIHLLGLDGRIKLSQTGYLSTRKLFSIIDAMPMRREEIRRMKKEE